MASRFLVLKEQEISLLMKPVKGQGGFQSLMRRLQKQFRTGTSELRIELGDIEQIQHYAFDYEQGGWEDDLLAIFERHLGPNLGRAS
jgi:hypothetical protein